MISDIQLDIGSGTQMIAIYSLWQLLTSLTDAIYTAYILFHSVSENCCTYIAGQSLKLIIQYDQGSVHC